jgi:L-ascorbate metabolism protein UlaG (beta-lactamase superfamily)
MALVSVAGCASPDHTPPSRIYYAGPKSDHFDGERFFNPEGEQGTGGGRKDRAGDFLRIASGRKGHHGWPRSVPVHQTVPPGRVEGDALRVTWIGHATTLIQTQGLNILLDPVWAWRDSPVQLVGPKRVRKPGVRLRDLPPIDAVLISHNHYDHMDIGTLKYLDRRDRPRIIVGLGNDKLLAEHGLKATAGDWGQTIALRPGVDITLIRAHHWSAHWVDDIDRSLWVGFRIGLPGGDIYYAGDTGAGDMKWAEQAIRPRPIRLAILPIAPYKTDGTETGNHINPGEAVAVFRMLRPDHALAVHWGTFELGGEPIDDAPRRLRAALVAQGIDPSRFRTLDAGEAWTIAPE